MKLKYFLCFLAMGFVAAVSAQTHKKPVKKKVHPYFILLEAYNQHILPIKPSVTPTTGDHFIIVWEAAIYPETFFWRGEGGWLPCKMMTAHKVVCKSPDFPAGLDYTISHVKGDDIHAGDTLELTPMMRGKFPIPPEIPADSQNTLYFRAGKSAWLAFPIKVIGKKPDVTMPE